jgi:hypothetical protein
LFFPTSLEIEAMELAGLEPATSWARYERGYRCLSPSVAESLQIRDFAPCGHRPISPPVAT